MLMLLALPLAGCEEGEPVDIDPGNGGGREVELGVTSAAPWLAGDTLRLRATVTEDGEPVVNVEVQFAVSPEGQPDGGFILTSSVQTNVAGVAETNMSTFPDTRNLTVTATAGAASTFLLVPVQAAP
jgi:hypothetical protein